LCTFADQVALAMKPHAPTPLYLFSLMNRVCFALSSGNAFSAAALTCDGAEATATL
jgi:hypothetical protein